ncbi:MAG TPA: DUF4396 domain-containing protein [Steroidobacteraceae bacterium]|jgi:hypothetical protein|nr:DUF4396 domain-containing protein [Steroidobacteraceae bacterium]
MLLAPSWLAILCTASLTVGFICAVVILIDVLLHPPHMPIMAIVWPVCALFGTVFLLWLYFRHGRAVGKVSAGHPHQSGHGDKPASSQAFPILVAKGTLHCGSGCTLGDIIAEWLAYAVPPAAIAFGWHSVFSEKTYAVWALDFALAFGFGIIFQYFALVPMRHSSLWRGIFAALKADTLSLLAWQIGMYCLMAFLQFAVFARKLGGPAPVDSPVFWGAMQLAMIAGFITSYPMNWWLIKSGVKEPM